MKRQFFFILIFFCFALEIKAENAGILPCAYKDGKLLALLGEESNGWSDFGGKGERGEGILQTALNEFSEETRYVFGKYAKGLDLRKKQNLSEIHAASIAYIQPKLRQSIKHQNGTYTMYLALVDYIPAQDFTAAYKTPDYDKREYAWAPLLELIDAVKNFDRENAYYKGMKIRKEFVDELQSEDMKQAVQRIIADIKKAK